MLANSSLEDNKCVKTYLYFQASSQSHIYEIAENTLQWQFEGKMTMGAHHTIWVLLTICQTNLLIINSIDTLPWLPTQILTGGVQEHIIICPKFWANHCMNICVMSLYHILRSNRKLNCDVGKHPRDSSHWNLSLWFWELHFYQH